MASAATPIRRAGPRCSHCRGTGVEPEPPDVRFSLSGAQRGAQQKLAEESGVSASTISRIFSGEITPSIRALMKLAAALDCSVDAILRVPAIAQRVASGE